jgi:putative solute:sodium symporter small subunit
MNRAVIVTALLVWLLVSFVPAISAANLMGKARKGS